jgi:hypothetical protein
VQEVLEYQYVFPVPLAPATLPGIINLRPDFAGAGFTRALTSWPVSRRVLWKIRGWRGATQDVLRTLLIDRVGEILDVHICKLYGQLLLILDLVKLCELPDQKAPAQTLSESNAAQTIST